MIKTAILVDGGFYRQKIVRYVGLENPELAADRLFKYCMWHISHAKEDCALYRVLYYDCPPAEKKVFHPLLNRTVDLKKDLIYRWNTDFFFHLKKKRKFALRMGKLSEEQLAYNLRTSATKELVSGARSVSDLTEADFALSVKQKGVDMRIGIDIVSMALKKQVEKIILISGDSDFVPAAKFARREGIDFVLDSMGATIKSELSEHIDGLTSFVSLFKKSGDVEDELQK